MTFRTSMKDLRVTFGRTRRLSIGTVVLVLCVPANSSSAQHAVQWRVEDGGNGHWYQAFWYPERISWIGSSEAAMSKGGHLVTITSAAESAFLSQQYCGLPNMNVPGYRGPWIGLRYLSGTWAWTTGEPYEYSAWAPGQPDFLSFQHSAGWGPCEQTWGNESGDDSYNPVWLMVEWSADCNSDGYVDYGQILQGDLVDSNANGTPDCCETGTPCEVDNPPVQWRVEDGGNGHWYQIVELANQPTCSEAASLAVAAGAKLIALETAPEADFFRSLRCSQGKQHLSGWQDLHRIDGVWTWGSGAPFTYQSWSTGQPDFGDTATIDWAGPSGQCDSITWGDEICVAGNLPSSLFLEWSADCNGDGYVDYGQMLEGEIPDLDGDGVPDTCEDADSDGDPEGRDCDDSDPARYTFAPETCGDLGIDNDCDGDILDTPDDSVTYHFDGDGDGIGGKTAPFPGQCPGNIPAGYSETLGDCDDENADVYPGAIESCDSIDSDCDSSLVDGFDDMDGDGYPDCIDEDLDNDGVPNSEDAFPLDPTESVDTDEDGIGDNADTDDDNDGVDDVADNCPLAANAGQADCNGDGIGDACQLLEDDVGFVRAWGRNDFGQTDIPADLGVCKAIAAGLWGTTAAIRPDDTVVVIGVNWYYPEITDVPSDLGPCRAIAAGSAHVLAVRADGTVRSWGESLGAMPIPPAVFDPRAIAAGGGFNIALLQTGHAVAWGFNNHGQCDIPISEVGIAVGAGQAHSMILRSDGSVGCYGWNDAGQSSPPVSIPPLVSVDGGVRHSIGLSSDGRLYAWGSNNHGQSTIPDGVGRVIDVDAGGNHNVALRSDGTVVCWGFNASGACEPPAGLGIVRAIAAGGDDYYRGGHTLVLAAGGYSDCDGSGTLDLCDVDDDSDGIPNACEDTDGDGVANQVDSDDDDDGVADEADNCPLLSNSAQADCDSDGLGDACAIAAGAADSNADGVPDSCQDCNGDGVMDVHQIRAGWLPDYDANQVPDCCEQGTPCEVSHYPVQWTEESDGNGHWYAVQPMSFRVSWHTSDELARSQGGHLVTAVSEGENSFVGGILCDLPNYSVPGYMGAWMGLIWHGGQWQWITGEPLSYTAWAPNQPDAIGFQTCAAFEYCAPVVWGNEVPDYTPYNPVWLVVEWSADCDSDGVVDYGQILKGELPDADRNGVPDGCQDGDGDGDPYSTDCDDADPSVNAGASEECDDVDSDCDGSLVDGFGDTDGDTYPDCIDDDSDNDGVIDSEDAFPFDPAESLDTDGDGIGDNADEDDDGDGVDDAGDNCVSRSNPDQADCNADGIGDACEIASGAADVNLDGIPDCCDFGGQCRGVDRRVPEEFADIQSAINTCAPGDRVLVAPGQYEGPISIGGRDIHLIATEGPSVTVLTGLGVTRVMELAGEPATALVMGFTIRDGYHQDYTGGGGVTMRGSSATFRNCRFVANVSGGCYPNSAWGAAALYSEGGAPRVEDCYFIDNVAGYSGSAIYHYLSGHLTVLRCDFEGNRNGNCPYVDNGTVHIQNEGGTISAVLADCRFVRCIGFGATAVGCFSPWDGTLSLQMSGCVISSPTLLASPPGNGGIAHVAIDLVAGYGAANACVLSDLVVCGYPQPVLASNEGGQQWLLTQDGIVLDSDGIDADEDDLCDAADPDDDGDGIEDVADNCPNLSNALQEDCDQDGQGDVCAIASGQLDQNENGVPDACEGSCDGDINSDGLVDAVDLALVLSQWDSAGGSPSADVNHDGMIEGKDLATVLSAWGPCLLDPPG